MLVNTLPPLFKLPLISVLNKLEFTPHKAQVEIISLLEKHRWVICSCGRRFGKSALAAHLAFAKLLEPDSAVGVCAPTHGLSSIIFDMVAKLLKTSGIETTKWSIKDKEIVLVNGSILKGLTASKPDSLVGRSYDFLIMDESALIPDLEVVWTQHLRATLSDRPGSRALFISTPRGNNYFKELYDKGFDPLAKEFACFHAPTSANPLIPEDDIIEAKENVSSTVFDQEYMALFTVFEGQIFKDVTYVDNLLDTLDRDSVEFIIGFDAGFDHSSAGVVVATNGECFWVVEEYKQRQLNTKDHAEWLQSMSDKYDVYNIYIDAAAAQTAHDLASLYDICSSPAIKHVTEGLAFMEGLFENKTLIIDSSLQELKVELEQYAWKPKTASGKEAPIKLYDDIIDSLRYAVYTFKMHHGGITV